MIARVATIVVTVLNAAIWGVPAAIYFWLWGSMAFQSPLPPAREWGAALMVFAAGPLQFGVGLVLALLLPINRLRRGNSTEALMVGGAFLVIGIADAGWGLLMLGSA